MIGVLGPYPAVLVSSVIMVLEAESSSSWFRLKVNIVVGKKDAPDASNTRRASPRVSASHPLLFPRAMSRLQLSPGFVSRSLTVFTPGC